MSLYLMLYVFIAVSLLTIWVLVFRKYWMYVYWKYFFIFSVLYFIWLILYVFSFTFVYNEGLVLILSRLMYWLSLTWLYNMLLFIIFFNSKEKKLISKFHLPIISILIIFFFLTAFTTFIVKDMLYNAEMDLYYEDLWIWYFLYTVLSFILPFLAIFASYIKVKKLNTINKIRFLYIISWFIFLVINEVIFLALLPAFDIWIFQKEQILFFIPFVWLTFYSIQKYHFSNIKVWVWKLLVLIISIFWTIIFTSLISDSFFKINDTLKNFWWIVDNSIITELILWILIFLIIYNLLYKVFLWNITILTYEKALSKLKKEIPYISNFPDLNSFLKMKFYQLFKIKYVEIILLNEEGKYNELIGYFNNESINDIFINDIVFIEENKNKFDKNIIANEINQDSYLIFPIYNNKTKLIWIFCLWQKPFGDTYNSEEIKVIKDFIEFISWHLKYLRIYDRINDLNINLDKMIDNKTMQYNTLLNKQKDFISLISHEIKWPVWSSIFQVDCLLDDIEDWKYDEKYLKKELWLLNDQLLKIWDLTNKLFSVEKYDIWKIVLLKEKVNINNLVLNELEMLKKEHKKIDFLVNLDDNIGFIELDKVQIIQVIENLINNAIKFSSKNNLNPQIVINTYLNNEYNVIEIEDNWKEFEYTDISSLFEKYTTWKWSSIWLWMWLYLCKKIIELHNWEIYSVNSEKLGWAKFIIKLPI